MSTSRGLLVIAMAFSALLIAPLTQATADPVAVPIQGSAPDLAAARTAMLARINAYRVSRGAPGRVSESRLLDAEAQWYATDMAANDSFNHDHLDSLGRLLPARLAAFGDPDGDESAQNSAAGYPDVDTTFAQWVASPAHEKTMRGRIYKAVGIGVAFNPFTSSGWFWVATFGPRDPTPSRDGPRRPVTARTSVTIDVPPPAYVAVRRCHASGGTSCLVVRPRGVRGARLQIARRRDGVWTRPVDSGRRTVVLRVRVGEAARVRAVAPGRPPVPGPWRIFKGGT